MFTLKRASAASTARCRGDPIGSSPIGFRNFSSRRRTTPRDNLLKEGIADARIHFVGNVMIDSLLGHAAHAISPAKTLARYDHDDLLRDNSSYGVVTLHRPSNVDEPSVLTELMGALGRISARLPLVFPVHPRTEARLRELDVDASEKVGFASAGGLPGDARPHARRHRRPDRFGRDAGGNDGARRPVHDAPREHRATCYRQ